MRRWRERNAGNSDLSLIMWVVCCVAIIAVVTAWFVRYLYWSDWTAAGPRDRRVQEEVPPPVVMPAKTDAPQPAPEPMRPPFGEFGRTAPKKNQ